MRSPADSFCRNCLVITSAWAVWVGYIALFGIAVETGVVMVVYWTTAKARRHRGSHHRRCVLRLRPKLVTLCVVLASLIPILGESGFGAEVMKLIAAPIVGGMI